MRKKWITVFGMVAVIAVLNGCGAGETGTSNMTGRQPTPTIAEQERTETPTDSIQLEHTAQSEQEPEEQQTTQFGFTDLSKRRFEFCSGAGAWSEEFTIEKDGYVTGKFHDADMGDVGEGYADGTFYCCSYSGHFTELIKVNEYTYRMTLSDISYKEEVDTEGIVDNVRYIYTESSFLQPGDTVSIYLPGAPVEVFSEDTWIWLSMANEGEKELSVISLVNDRSGYGVYSCERFAPLEDAKMTYQTYKDSYDYFNEKLINAMTTMEMVECLSKMYEHSDECLNYIWNLVRYNTKDDVFEDILEEQRAWIKEKEAAAEESQSMYEGGTLAQVDYLSVLADMTIKRCEELIKYLE